MAWLRDKNMQLVVGVVASWTLMPTSSTAFPLQRDETAGQAALRDQGKTSLYLRHDLSVVDGKVTSTPPDATRYDRRLENVVSLGAQVQPSPKIGFRLGLFSELSRYRLADDLDEEATTDGSRGFYQVNLDVTYVTPTGLTVFVGAQRTLLTPSEEKLDATLVTSTTSYNAASVDTPRIGAVRRAASATFGVFYLFGEETERSFRKSASDGTEFTGTDKVHVPTELGLFAKFGLGAHTVDFEFRAVQAGEGGNRSEDGTAVADDHFVARLGGAYGLAGYKVTLSAQHKTLSYARSAFMTLETIPATLLRLGLQTGAEHAFASGGLLFMTGRDVQSLPEFNARYELLGYGVGLTAGLSF